MDEKRLEARCKSHTRSLGGLFIKLPAAYEVGIPDRLVLMPGGRVFFVEFKRAQAARRAKAQEWWRRRLRRLGFVCEFVWDFETFKEIVGGSGTETS